MSGLMGGSWKRGSPAGHGRVLGWCAEKRHRDGLIGTQPADHLPPRQVPTRLRYGNSAREFSTVDSYVHERLAILASVKHRLPGRNWARRFTYRWVSSLGAYRLLEQCGHGLRMPRGERCRRAVCGRTARTVR
jgi:hypothetical protein